ncbi:MAG TPA: cation diffusion facilitator family transporter [Polyangiaceae bacterium]
MGASPLVKPAPERHDPHEDESHDHAQGHRHDHSHGHAHGERGGHGHSHSHRTADPAARRALFGAVVLTGGFMFVEASVGLYSRSLALLADAGHMLADVGALALALIAQRVAEKPRTERSTFGYRRAEVLAAFVNGMLLAGISFLILKEAGDRYFEPVPIRGGAMLATAVGGLAINLLVALILMRSQAHSLNVRAAFAHVLSDALGSVAAIIAGVAVVVWSATRVDALVSTLIAFLVAWSGFRVLRETAGILLEAAPPHLDVAAVERTIRESPGVADVHDLHVWRISERFDTLTAHVVLLRGEHGTEVSRRVAERLATEHGLDHVTIQPEAPPPDDVVAVRASRDGAVIQGPK